MRPVPVVAREELVKASLLLQHVGSGWLGRFAFERQVHALMTSILLRMAGCNAFDLNAQA